jgi:hypothetical protein
VWWGIIDHEHSAFEEVGDETKVANPSAQCHFLNLLRFEQQYRTVSEIEVYEVLCLCIPLACAQQESHLAVHEGG